MSRNTFTRSVVEHPRGFIAALRPRCQGGRPAGGESATASARFRPRIQRQARKLAPFEATAATATGTALFARPGLIDGQTSAVLLLVVEIPNRRPRGVVVRHF